MTKNGPRKIEKLREFGKVLRAYVHKEMVACGSFSWWVMLRERHGGLYKAPTKKGRRKQKAKRRERSDQVY